MRSLNVLKLRRLRLVKDSVLAAVMAVALLSGCGSADTPAAATPTGGSAQPAAMIQETVPEAGAESDSLIHDLLSDWFDFLYINECGYGNLIWASEKVLSFSDSPDWNGLLLARMAVSAAGRDTEERELEPALLEQEDYDLLLSQGMDVYNIPIERGSWEDTRDTLRQELRLLQSDLTLSVFWKYDLEVLREKAEIECISSEAILDYLAAETEYILFTLGQGDETERFQTFLSEYCPRIAACLPEERIADEETIQAWGNRALDSVQTLLMQRNALQGKMQANLDTLGDRIEGGDYSALAGESTVISGLPQLLPLPDWASDAAETLYFWEDSDGTLSAPSAGDALEKAPDGCRLIFRDVEKAALLSYRDFLTELGVDCLSTKEKEDGSVTVYYELEQGTLMLTWKDGDVTALFTDGVLCFAPEWYIIAAAQRA